MLKKVVVYKHELLPHEEMVGIKRNAQSVHIGNCGTVKN